MDKASPLTSNTYVPVKPTQEVDVLAALDFEIPCYRQATPGFHPRPTKGRKRGAQFEDGEDVEDRPEEPCSL